MKTKPRKNSATPIDIYERITELLEQGVKPWEPSHFVQVGLSRTRLTKCRITRMERVISTAFSPDFPIR